MQGVQKVSERLDTVWTLIRKAIKQFVLKLIAEKCLFLSNYRFSISSGEHPVRSQKKNLHDSIGLVENQI